MKWCRLHNVSKYQYYYRQKEVRKHATQYLALQPVQTDKPVFVEVAQTQHPQPVRPDSDLVPPRVSGCIRTGNADILVSDATREKFLEKFPDGKWKRLLDHVCRCLEFHPTYFEVLEHHMAVYAGNYDKKIVRAPRLADLLRNSIVTPPQVAGIYNYKYVNSQSNNRLAKAFKKTASSSRHRPCAGGRSHTA